MIPGTRLARRGGASRARLMNSDWNARLMPTTSSGRRIADARRLDDPSVAGAEEVATALGADLVDLMDELRDVEASLRTARM